MEHVPDGCTVVLRVDQRRVEIRVHDSSWRGVLALRAAVVESTEQPGQTLSVDLQEISLDRASSFWLAALVALARLARARGCSLILLEPPRQLADPLTRLRLDVAYPSSPAGEIGRL